uniref:Uncharacterized protein n=1 Tax=Amphimedon queenslandica TaxID=400682 RepID=A0A1X7SU64_AMPQE
LKMVRTTTFVLYIFRKLYAINICSSCRFSFHHNSSMDYVCSSEMLTGMNDATSQLK